eukprot:TRINITY_DN34784_c0_g1_i1.p1 TRINITY_DN34784_c0_g1~~TRINITY_DN34784_c0_g1_i1.p1  ORF type:complete len:239 (-),score=45.02 TRINITY_DN34784_c0_g1_i1:315-1031(-)
MDSRLAGRRRQIGCALTLPVVAALTSLSFDAAGAFAYVGQTSGHLRWRRTDNVASGHHAHAPGSAAAAGAENSDDTTGSSRRWLSIGSAVASALLLCSQGAEKASARKPPKPVIAQDQQMQPVTLAAWTKKHAVPDLVLGLSGEPYWLLPGANPGTIRNYSLKAECTHLGCIAPWNEQFQKFVCPCHGSEYDPQGMVLKGPAPKSLQLAHLSLAEGEQIELSAWTDTDFRDGTKPWWS